MVWLTSIEIRESMPIFDFNVSNIRAQSAEGSAMPTTRSLRTLIHWRNRRTDMRAIPVIQPQAIIEVVARPSPVVPRSKFRCREAVSTESCRSSVVEGPAASTGKTIGVGLIDAKNANVKPVPTRSAINPPTAQAYLARGSAA